MIPLLLLCILIVVLLARAILFQPLQTTIEQTPEEVLDGEQIIEHFRQLLRHKTVSHIDKNQTDLAAFQAFQKSLVSLYPEVNKNCTCQYLGETGILYHWKGTSQEDPIVLMSHYDVVPAEESAWDVPPFEAAVIDGIVWGRGTLDTKCTLLSVMESAEHLIKEGFVPSQDIYFSFSGDEEISGESASAIVNHLKNKGIKPQMVLDEGGVVIKDGIFPGVNKQTAVIGLGEKGYIDLQVQFESKGGHASAPPRHGITGAMGKLMADLENKTMKPVFMEPVLEMFNRLGRHSTFGYKIIFANMWLFKPLLTILFKKQGGQMNALIRTTTAVTVLEGSKAYNVLPPKGTIGINARILNTDTMDSTINHISSLVKVPHTIQVLNGREASPISPLQSNAFRALEDTILDIWPQAVVSPYLMIAGTDSRHFHAICDNVLRFAPMEITQEELNLIHSNNERIPVDSVLKSVTYYIKLIRRLGSVSSPYSK
ncbi:M20 family peptidase [Gottschalkiaceae bacterium SANA]|nr:M20 family peptidase [Gottschalkiaceae bacterium SANA]